MVHVDRKGLKERGLTCNGYHLPYRKWNVGYARTMRKDMTPAEKKMWYGFLRNFKYRVLRQRPIDNFIADFYCPKLKLVIEVDGDHHLSGDMRDFDEHRTEVLSAYGLTVIRFHNEEVENDFTAVCEVINSYLE